MRYALEIKGDKAFASRIGLIEKRAGHLGPVLKAAAAIMQAGLARNFASKGEYFNAPWPELAAATLKRKAREGLPSEILAGEGLLQASLHGGPDSVTRITPLQVRVGSKDFTARFHQGGTDRIPARPVVDISREDRYKILGLLKRYIVGPA